MQSILSIHIIAVVLFLLMLGVKTVLLLAGKNEMLGKFNKITKIPNMIVSAVFLGTGIYLMLKIGMKNIGGWFHLKLTLSVIGIVIGIIAFKKMSKILAVSCLLLFLYIYGLSETKNTRFGIGKKKVAAITDPSDPEYDIALHGEKIYLAQCWSCHGDDGDKGISGASPLSKSALSEEENIAIIKKGRKMMRSFENQLSEEEIRAVSAFIKTLRK